MVVSIKFIANEVAVATIRTGASHVTDACNAHTGNSLQGEAVEALSENVSFKIMTTWDLICIRLDATNSSFQSLLTHL